MRTPCCIVVLSCLDLAACLTRVDPGTALRALPPTPAQTRFLALYQSSDCQQRIDTDDVECWSEQRDANVVVQTGISRTLNGYLAQPYTIQTHLKVRFADGSHGEEVYYFADGGEGGLESREGYGVADGRINVFCTTESDHLSEVERDDNEALDQRTADAVAQCVHQALLESPRFAKNVRGCLAELRGSVRIARR